METNSLQLYTVAQAARLLSVSTKTIWRLIYKREIHFVRIQRRVLIPEKAIKQFIDANTTVAIEVAEIASKLLDAS